MALEGRVAVRLAPGAELVDEEGQRSGGGDARVELAQRARRGVARIDEERLALLLPAGVDAGEVGAAEEDLAPHLQPGGQGGRPGRRGSELERQRAQGAEVGGDVLPHLAVAAGGPFGELAVGVDQLHRQAVELGLADVVHLVRAEDLVDPGVELGQLLVGEGVGQAEHRAAVGDRRGSGRRAFLPPGGWGSRGCGARESPPPAPGARASARRTRRRSARGRRGRSNGGRRGRSAPSARRLGLARRERPQGVRRSWIRGARSA